MVNDHGGFRHRSNLGPPSIRTQIMSVGQTPAPSGRQPVYSQLKSQLIAYRFPPGSHLQINALAEKMNVSTTPVREALNHLHAEHLVSLEEKKGFFAKTLNLQEIQDLYDLGFVLFRETIDRICANPNTPPGEPDALIKILRDPDQTVATHVTAIEAALDLMLHQTKSRAMMQLGSNLGARTHFVRALDIELWNADEQISSKVARFVKKVFARKADAAHSLHKELHERKRKYLPDLIKEGLIRQSNAMGL